MTNVRALETAPSTRVPTVVPTAEASDHDLRDVCDGFARVTPAPQR